MSGTALADHVVFHGDSDRLDFLLGGQGDDLISDGADDAYWSDDVFMGQQGNDTLISTEGNDAQRGGKGDDDLKVRFGWYGPSELQFPLPGAEPGNVGHNLEVRSGKGWDTLIIQNSEVYTMEQDGHYAVLHSIWGASVTVYAVEEIISL